MMQLCLKPNGSTSTVKTKHNLITEMANCISAEIIKFNSKSKFKNRGWLIIQTSTKIVGKINLIYIITMLKI